MTRLSPSALRVLQARYLQRDAAGNVVETPEALFRRVAHAIAQAETIFGDTRAAERWQETFEDVMTAGDFLPNSPVLMNAGTPLGQLAACFVLPVQDSMESIFDAL
jgi:ribonucleoside-diphosphate reductase alpha chain